MSESAPIPPAQDTVLIGGVAVPVVEAVRRVRSSASWFFWLAGLSLINTFATLSDSQYGMVLGLGYTQVIDAVFQVAAEGGAGAGTTVLHLVLVAGVAAVFIAFGVFGRRLQAWAFVVGMLAYVIDSLLFVVSGDWIAVGFHAFVLFMLYGGYSTLRALNAGASEVRPV